MNKKFKFLTVLLALVMTLGAFAPFGAVKAAEEHKTDVVIHKMELKDLTGWPKDAGVEGADKTKYDGTKLGLGYFGEGAKELANVKFYVFKITEENYNTMKDHSSEYTTKDDVTTKITGATLIKNGDKDYFETTADGATVEGLVDGYYWIVEDKDSVSRDGRTFSGAAAVPFGLSLPYAKADGKPFGQGKDALHVYPKNTLADKPVVDKDFKGKANPESPRTAEQKNKPEPHNVGDIIEYEVKTIFQPNTQYKTAFWTDQMTEGLSFNQDSVEVKVGDTTLVKDTDYTVDTTVNTFKVVLTDKGLEKVNNQAKQTTVTISYNATLTNKAKVDVPESNDVVFHYGNNPSKGNTPVPNNPSNGEMEVTKTWPDGAPAETKEKPVKIEVTLYDANTGEVVPGTPENPNPTFLTSANNWTAKWTGLDDNKKYKVVEKVIDNYDAEYGTDGAGKITIKNHKTNNPKPINPDEPKVVTRGKKFVKMEKNTDIRLKDAVFYVKNSEGKYLQPSNGADKSAFEAAQDAYSKAVEEYNKLDANTQKTDNAKKKVQDAADARDKAWNEYLSNMTQWGDKKTALELKSDEAGAFEIKGLMDGTYYLEEKTAPAGYGKIEGDIKFTLGKGSYTTGDINYNPLVDKKDATRVDNTKITIPQTGGIGTVIFTVVGVMLMVGAAFALKRRKEDELEGLA